MKSFAWCGNRTVARTSSVGGLHVCTVGLDILKCEQTLLFYSASYFNVRSLELCLAGLSPLECPRGYGTVWQNFSFLFEAIDSEKYLSYAIYQAFCL